MANQKLNTEIFFICDRKKCGVQCNPFCKYTSDIKHAVNFQLSSDGSGYFENKEITSYTTYFWVCPECGANNDPNTPCVNCGNNVYSPKDMWPIFGKDFFVK